MVAVCQQPNYFPWLGYLEQCARAQTLVLLDSVQWIRNGRQHRVRILPHVADAASSHYQWLTLPVLGHGHREKNLKDMRLDPQVAWHKYHWRTLQSVYGKRPHFKDQLEPLLRPWFEKASQFTFLFDASVSSMQLCFDALEIRPQIQRSTELPETGVKTERLISLCQAVSADTYYSGLGSTKYIDIAAFRAADIRLIWQHWKHPSYDQGREKFQSHLSILDLLANISVNELKSSIEQKPWGPFGDVVLADHAL